MTTKKRLLFVATSLGYGGAAKVLCFVAGSLSKLGYDVHIANIMTTDTNIEQTVPAGITVHTASSDKGRGLRRLEQLIKVKKIAKKIGADIIIGFTFYPNIIACMVAKQLGIKSIVSERGDPNKTFGNDFISKMTLAIINAADGGVFQTDGAMRFYSKKLQEKGKVIPNPIFIPSYGVPKRNDNVCNKTVVSVGRIDNSQKRYDVMLKAFSIFVQSHPEYTLRLIGDGPDEHLVHKWCSELGIDHKVQFFGKSKQPMKDIVNDGIFIITSDYEGISNALLEAMAVGLPCVSTDHSPGGARFLISDHENGLLAPIGDAEKLAEALCEFADNCVLSQKCSEKARNVVCRFSPETIIAEWDQYLMSLCK